MAGEVFSEAEKAKLKILFDKLDSKKDGFIRAEDFKHFASELGKEMTDERANELVKKGDPNGTGKVDFQHFVLALSASADKVKAVILAIAIFREIDVDNSGFITKSELRRVCQEAGANVPDAQLDELIAHVDTSGDGKINMKEFLVALATFVRSRVA